MNRAKTLFERRKVLNADRSEQQILSLTLRGVVENDPENPEGLVPSDYATYQIFDRDDLVFKLIDLENVRTSRVGHVHRRGIMSSAYLRLSPKPDVCTRYFYWQFFDLYNRRVFNDLGNGVRSTLGGEDVLELPLLVPSLMEQRAIADYLDAETARIDALIEKKQRILAIEVERETSLLCTYLIPGFIPGSTDYIPLKRLVKKIIRTPGAGAGVVTAFRDGTVTLRSKRREEGFTFSETESTYVGVEPGDLVFHGLDGFEGAVGVSDSLGKMSPVNHALLCDEPKTSARYLSLVLRALGRVGYLSGMSSNVRQRAVDFRNFENLGVVRVPIPPLDEQMASLEKYEDAISKSRLLRSLLEDQLQLLSERRQAVISAAVTGELDITAGAA